MPKRNKSYNKYIANKMQDLDFAKEVLLSSMREFNSSLEEALKETIEKMGIKEFSILSGISIQNVSDFIRGKKRLKAETLDKYLSVFKLKSKIIAVEKINVPQNNKSKDVA